MNDYKSIVKYNSFANKIIFPYKISSYIIADFAAAINLWLKIRPSEPLTLDFSGVTNPYSNGMLPIIATVHDLRLKGFGIKALLPHDAYTRRIFRSTNWAWLLDPQYPRSESTHDRHLVTTQFTDGKDLLTITKGFMDIVLRNMSIPSDITSALEWSVYEICDNVINHSESKTGGFVEVVTFPKQDVISFTVADAGRGILDSLKEGIPTLRTDVQAIGEAIKAGVTRNKEFGQGNGLAGSLRITTMTGGSIDILSGSGRFYSTLDNSNKTEGRIHQSFKGTSVSGYIKMNKNFSIGEALKFGGTHPYVPVNLIDLQYEMEDKDCLLIKMKTETTGFGTRHAGRQMRTKTLNLINSHPKFPVYIDWEGIPVISSSFADEYMGKLFLEIGPLNFSAIIRNKNMELLVKQLLDKAILQRLAQEAQEIPQ